MRPPVKLLLTFITMLLFAKAYAQCTASITPGTPGTVLYGCTGTPLTLTANTGTGYQWALNGNVIAGATAQTYTITNSGTYNVTVYNGACSATASVTVSFVAPPSVTITASATTICTGDTVSMCTPSCVSCTYQWQLNGVAVIPAAVNGCLTTTTGGNYTVHIVNTQYGCVSTSAPVAVTVNPRPSAPTAASNSPIAIGDTIMLTAQDTTTGVSYNWTGPNSYTSTLQNPDIYNATAVMSGSYGVYASLNGCNSAYTFVPVLITDFVWPGDANDDHVVDNTDILSIALAYGHTGPGRSNASTSWTPQVCNDWSAALPASIVNMKHADCNGDSTVDYGDTTAVSLNYGQVHAREAHHAQAKVAGVPDLYFDTNGISFAPGTAVSVPIKLGTASMPMSQVMGIAAQVKISGLTLNAPPHIQYTASWLAGNNQAVRFSKAQGTNQLDWAYARNDHQDTNGSGTIATLVFDIPANAPVTPAVLYFDNVILIAHNGNYITGVNILDDSIEVAPLTVCCAGPLTQQATILPNPSRGVALLEFSLFKASTITLQITDITGKTVSEQQVQCIAGTQQVQLPAAQVVPGVYNVTIRAKDQPVQTVKWVKEN